MRFFSYGQSPPARNEDALSKSLEANLEYLRSIFADCSDLVIRTFLIAQQPNHRAALIYFDGLVDKTQVSNNMMKTSMLELPMAEPNLQLDSIDVIGLIRDRSLAIHQIEETSSRASVIKAILAANSVLLVDGCTTAIINGVKGWESRDITQAESEVVIRGPRESFVESLRTNTSMLRRRIKSADFKMEKLVLGRLTETDIVIAYLKGIAPDDLVAEVKRRLGGIEVDSILESGYIEEFIEDTPWTPFPLANHTERPDNVAAAILEGRVAIITDGTPEVLTVPTLFVEFVQAPDDYYEKFYLAFLVRSIRYISLTLSLLLPSLYIAVITFHQEMLPTTLMLSVARQREMVPFPAFVEALLMELSFEALREAGLRLPRQVGQAVSIVGALIIGEAGVRAGIVAPFTVIIVAITGISSFMIAHSLSAALRLFRFPIMILSATLGLFGVICGAIALLVHLVSLRSFGVPYLSPLAPMSTGDLKDVVFRAPWWAMWLRPRLIGRIDPERQRFRLKPTPQKEGPK